MANELALPAFFANLPQRNLAATASANLGTGALPFLSIMGNRFTLIDTGGNEKPVATYDPAPKMQGQGPGPYLDCVVIDINNNVSQIFYGTKFDPNAASYKPPGCFSHNGIAPSRQAAEPQSPTCASCPNKVWGSATSAITGKGIPACSTYQQIAILPVGETTPFLFRIPPNSLKNFRAYTAQYTGQAFDVDKIITRLSYEPGTLGTLLFQPTGWIDEAIGASMLKILESKYTDTLVGRTDQPIQGALPAPAAQATLPAPSPTPAAPVGALPPMQGLAQHVAAAQPVPASEPSTGRRKRRTGAEMAAQAAPAPTQAPFPSAPPFGVAPTPSAPSNFGIAPGVAPHPGLAATLDAHFPPRT